ncbi:MAG TPA: MmgE/PrpD family protein [Acidimicrobiia bacterium]|nr:MmgE/PrpD family protein [Acidimicrobiia bacterium]
MGAGMSLSGTLAEFVVATDPASIPMEARQNAVAAIADTMATTVGGSSQPAPLVARKTLLAQAGPGGSLVVGSNGRTTDPSTAALLNGMSAHALDFDVISFAVSGFVASAITCALAAIVEDRPGETPGEEVVTALVLGWESAAAIARVINPEHYARGWHPTATLSAIGAAMAASRLKGLDADQTRSALSVAVSEAGGVKTMIGNMLNPYHVGKGARTGVVAAELAAAGFVGHPDALDAPQGYLNVVQGPEAHRVELAIASVGTYWDLVDPGPIFKIYPCCGLAHSAMDAIHIMKKSGAWALDEVERVLVRVHEYVPKVMTVVDPQDGYQAKFSIPYCVAAAMCEKTELDAFDAVDSEIVGVSKMVEFEVHPDLTGGETFLGAEFSEVVVTTRTGEHSQRVMRMSNRGTGSPVETAPLAGKFKHCLRFGGYRGDADEIWDRLTRTDGPEGFRYWSLLATD